MADDLTGYLGSVQLPGNPYEKKVGFGEERGQWNADINMAQYNQQVHEAELLKQREWALADRNYNSPAQLRQRLEDAGYNPALMAGAIQTANAPVRTASANSPTSQATNMSGYASNKTQLGSNILQAGQNLISAVMSEKQMQAIDSQINLQNAQGIETLSRAAKTDAERKNIQDLLPYQKDAMLQNMFWQRADTELKYKEISEIIPQRLKNMQQEVKFSEAQINNMAQQMGINKRLSAAEIRGIEQSIKESASRILNNTETLEQIKLNVRNGRVDLAMKAIELEVHGATKYANIAAPYVNIVTEGISNAIGISKVGLASKAFQQGQQNWQSEYNQRERQFTPNSTQEYFTPKGKSKGYTRTTRY